MCTLTAPLSEELRHAVEIDDASRTAALLARLDGGKALTVAGYAEALRACGDADAPDNALTGAIPVESARVAYN